MPPKSKAAKARAANLRKASAARKASKGNAPAAAAEDADLPQPPQKKQRTEPAVQPAQIGSTEPGTVGKFITQGRSTSDGSTAATSAPPAAPMPAPARGMVTNDSDAGALTGATTVSMPTNGSFCLYSMKLPFLQTALVPDAKTGKKDYAALFKKLTEFQTKQPEPDRTAQCYIHFPSDTGKGYGRLSSALYGFTEPMGDEPYDVGIAGLKEETSLALQVPAVVGGGGAGIKGVSGTAVLATSDCGVASAHGVFKMRTVPVWKSGDAEIYEGYVVFGVKYGMYARKGHGSGTTSSFAFWAIRSREGDALKE